MYRLIKLWRVCLFVVFFFVFQPGFVASVAPVASVPFVGWAFVALVFFTCLSIYLI